MTASLVQREVDGVPTFVVDSGQTPVAMLSFRVGTADERLATHGWTHLVEHLTMHAVRRPEVDANASVDLWMTQFSCSGDRAEVVRWLRDVCEHLTHLGEDAIEHERKVLLAEAAQRRYTDVGWHLDLRYGARGVGLANYDELGLHLVTTEGLRAHAGRFLTRGNATLALNFDPGDDLSLPLPEGDRVPIPQAAPLRLHLPGRHPGRPDAITVSGTLDDSRASNVVAAVCAEAVTERLRHQHGASYGTHVAIERVDEQTLVLCLLSDVTEEVRRTAPATVRDVLRGIASDGADPDTVTRALIRMRRMLDDDPTQVWQAFNSAHTRLRGDPEPVTAELVRDHLAGFSPDTVTQQVAGFVESAIYGTPEEGGMSFGLPDLMYPQGQEDGARSPGLVKSATTVFRPLAPDDVSRLAVADHAVAVRSSTDLRWFGPDEVEATLAYPDGARTLVTRDGRSLHVEPGLWSRGGHAAQMLEEWAGSDTVIPMPARTEEQIVRPSRRAVLRRRVAWALGTWAAIPVLLLLAFVAIALEVPGFVAAGVAGGLGAAIWQSHKDADRGQRPADLFD